MWVYEYEKKRRNINYSHASAHPKKTSASVFNTSLSSITVNWKDV